MVKLLIYLAYTVLMAGGLISLAVATIPDHNTTWSLGFAIGGVVSIALAIIAAYFMVRSIAREKGLDKNEA